MNCNIKKITLLVALHSIAVSLWADWPVGKGRTTLIATYSYLNSSKYFDANGKVVSFGNNDQFQSHFIGLTAIHGISRRVDFIMNVPFVKQEIITNGKHQTSFGVTDITAGFSYHFPSEDYNRHLTLKAMVIVPAYENINEPFLGYASRGFSGAINYSFSPAKDFFCILEGGYTRYIDTDDGPSQLKGMFTLGKSLDKYSLLTFNFSHMASKSINTNFNTNLSTNKNLTSGTINIAYGRKLTRTITPFIQGLYTLYGTNAGVNLGATFFIIFKFP